MMPPIKRYVKKASTIDRAEELGEKLIRNIYIACHL